MIIKSYMIMKKTILMTALIAAASVMSSCGQKDTAPAEGSRTGFAISFFKNVNDVVRSSENIVVSPYSAGVALSMLEEGAGGETKAEFDNALNSCLFKAEEFATGDKVVVRSANSVWISDDFSVRNHYVDLLQKDYDALVTTQNFSDPATLHAINNWCSENTDGKIKGILDRISPNTVMILANALYFNASWESRFDANLTREQVFHGENGDGKVKMMSRKGRYNYVEYQGAQMIELPYSGGTYAMYVVLPPDGMAMDKIIPYINESMFDSALQNMESVEVRFKMPRMKLETSMSLNSVLKNMGVQTAFGPAADFSGIAAMGPLVLSEVNQKCYIDVTENGTEAAAVTSAQIQLTSVRPELDVKTMTVDRPFIFFIADRNTSDILFAGKIVNL